MAEETLHFSDDGDLLKKFQTQVFFEENLGQFDPAIQYQTYVLETQVRFLANGLSFAAIREIERDEPPTPGGNKHSPKIGYLGEQEPDYEALIWNMTFLGMNESAIPAGKTAYPGHINYLKGNIADNWSTGVQRYEELWYEDMYEQIDLRYYGTGAHQLKYDFVLKPGFDLSQVQMRFEGIQGMDIGESGELILYTPWGEVVDAAPYSYQILFGKEKPVDIRYRIIDGETIGFEIHGAYDAQKTLVLDPLTLDWGTFFHTSTSDDYVMAVKRDAVGNIYCTGYTKALNFPVTPGIYQSTFSGSLDVYVAKLGPNGDNLIYATFLGGSNWEMSYGLDLNAANEVYVAGFTTSTDYPTSSGAFQEVSGGGLVESFVTRLSANGDALIFSTYFGGADRDYIYDMEIDAAGNAYLTGFTLSANFPTTPDAYSTTITTNGDAFVSKMAADGASLIYSTLIGGSQYEIAQAIEVNAQGEAYVVGNTASANFPVTPGVIQPTLQTAPGSTQEDGFLFRLNATGSSLIYSTYFGGTASDVIYDIDLNAAGEAFITGITFSPDLPITPSAYQTTISGAIPSLGDAFVARINAHGTAIGYSTFLGGTEIDFGKSIEVNTYGEVYILGSTRSANFPVSGEVSGYAAMYDIFLTGLNAAGSAITQSTLLGGMYNDYPRAPGSLSLENEHITIVATTHSGDAEVTTGAYQTTKTNGLGDAPWVIKLQAPVVLRAGVRELRGKWEAHKRQSLLEWSTGEGMKGLVYEVERRNGQESWKTIGASNAEAAADTSALAFADREAGRFPGQVLLYRLRYTGEDGAIHHSQVASVAIPTSDQAAMHVYPNPANRKLSVEVYAPAAAGARLAIVNLIGQTVASHTFDAGSAREGFLQREIDVSNLPAGLYYLQLKTGAGTPLVQTLVISH